MDEASSSSNTSKTMTKDSPSLPAGAKHSGKINNNTCAESSEPLEDASDTQPVQGHHYLMTTRELQLYWLKEKHEGNAEKLLFEIPSTRIAEDFLSKYVVYQIVIIKTGSFDENKVFIERRYSDFEMLHRSLLKDFKEEMEDVLFPKKILMGNLTEELIGKRKQALKDYLEELNAINCVRKSRKFIEFFTFQEIEEGYSCLRGGKYGRAMDIFQQIVCLQDKLSQHSGLATVPTLCALVVCHKDLDNLDKAYEVGMKALTILEKHPGHRYYTPLLDTLISLAYKMGKDFVTLQEKMEKGERRLRDLGQNLLTLKEVAVQEFVS
ncbi:sorting nexin-20 [Pelodytes ibericus]